MKKWGVRLIGVLFLLWAVKDTFALADGTSNGFLKYVVGDIWIDVSTPIQICLFLYAGFQVIRLDKSGRTWALIMLFWNILWSGLALFFLFSIPINGTLMFHSIFGDLNASQGVIINIVWITLMFLIPLFYLLRKDIKALFEPPTIPDVPQAVTDVRV